MPEPRRKYLRDIFHKMCFNEFRIESGNWVNRRLCVRGSREEMTQKTPRPSATCATQPDRQMTLGAPASGWKRLLSIEPRVAQSVRLNYLGISG